MISLYSVELPENTQENIKNHNGQPRHYPNIRTWRSHTLIDKVIMNIYLEDDFIIQVVKPMFTDKIKWKDQASIYRCTLFRKIPLQSTSSSSSPSISEHTAKSIRTKNDSHSVYKKCINTQYVVQKIKSNTQQVCTDHNWRYIFSFTRYGAQFINGDSTWMADPSHANKIHVANESTSPAKSEEDAIQAMVSFLIYRCQKDVIMCVLNDDYYTDRIVRPAISPSPLNSTPSQ
jgi:hypothetical protein